MKMIYTILLFFTFISLFFSCKTVSVQQYFRTYDNENLIYKFQKDSLKLTTFYDDTLLCKIVVRYGVLAKRKDENFNIFYFDQPNLSSIKKSESPFQGFSYFFDKGALYIGQNEGTLNPMIFSQFKKLIPNKIKKGDSFEFKGSDYKSVYNFIGFEDFQWHKLPILKCLKFSITEVYSNKKYFIWFSKKWGIVKWTKANGDTGILYE